MGKINLSLGDKILMLRKEARYSQRLLAEAVGCSQPSLWAYENNKKMPPYRVLEKLISIAKHNKVDVKFI